jgi:hypothetical protein
LFSCIKITNHPSNAAHMWFRMISDSVKDFESLPIP